MIQLVRTISNPLTIIAIFAALAEVFGTVSIQFMEPEVQYIFVWFLVGFPSVLVLLFFATLNWNRAALYAPGDYKNEDNWMYSLRGQELTSDLEALDARISAVQAGLLDKTLPATEKIESVASQLSVLQTKVGEIQASAREDFEGGKLGRIGYVEQGLNSARARAAVLATLRRGPSTIEEIVEFGGLSRRTARETVARLVMEGQIGSAPVANAHMFVLTPSQNSSSPPEPSKN